MVISIVALLLFSYAVGRWSASCEISGIEQYINRGGQIVANSSGVFDYGIKTGLNVTGLK